MMQGNSVLRWKVCRMWLTLRRVASFVLRYDAAGRRWLGMRIVAKCKLQSRRVYRRLSDAFSSLLLLLVVEILLLSGKVVHLEV